MAFITDKQTLDDLNLSDRYGNNSIFALFNQVKTKGGESILDSMFRIPLSDENGINSRSNLFHFFQKLNYEFPFAAKDISVMEAFLSFVEQPNWFASLVHVIRRKSLFLIGVYEEQNLFVQGLFTTLTILKQLDSFIATIQEGQTINPYLNQILSFQKFYQNNRFTKIKYLAEKNQLTPMQLMESAYLFGTVFYQEMLKSLQMIYELDVFLSVAGIAEKYNLNYAKALPQKNYSLAIDKCRHPTLKKAVGNDVNFDLNNNVLFLTGANMAGKSTLMKSIGSNLYLAHMGFPVAAEKMEFSVRDGIFTSINVPDNLNQGFSHFYAEVLRVKAVAESVGASQNLLVIFDELFKGTNVKDAFDATLAVTKAFAEYHNCIFVISTHILEVAEDLKNENSNIKFSFLPTIMNEKIPSYTYILENGVSSDRHGMMIIENEGIISMLSEKR